MVGTFLLLMFCIYKLGVPWIPPLVNNDFNLVIISSILTVYICPIEIYSVKWKPVCQKMSYSIEKKRCIMSRIRECSFVPSVRHGSLLCFVDVFWNLNDGFATRALLYLKMVVPFNFNEAFKSSLTTMKDFGVKKLDALDCFHVSEQSNWNFDFK